MSKFLNKKEQVIDLKLTGYGNYLLSIGAFKPTYFTFVDDNVVYDSQYFGRSGEAQNEIHKRIKQDTQYIESLVLFEELNPNPLPNNELNFFQSDIDPTMKDTRIDEFRLNSIIGDAFVGEDKQKAPSWKVVSLRGDISSSSPNDTINDNRIPQINIVANYKKKIIDVEEYENISFNTSNEVDFVVTTEEFADGKVIYLESADVVIYVEEQNVELLNENFDIEVFEIQDGTTINGQRMFKKYFENKNNQIVDGYMVSSNENENFDDPSADSVEKLFNILIDSDVDSFTACKLAEQFNKQSFLIDLDFDCTREIDDDLFYDIYGSETEAEICQT
jgi:hypothetical protein